MSSDMDKHLAAVRRLATQVVRMMGKEEENALKLAIQFKKLDNLLSDAKTDLPAAWEKDK